MSSKEKAKTSQEEDPGRGTEASGKTPGESLGCGQGRCRDSSAWEASSRCWEAGTRGCRRKATWMDAWRVHVSRKKSELLAGSPELSHEIKGQSKEQDFQGREQPGKKRGPRRVRFTPSCRPTSPDGRQLCADWASSAPRLGSRQADRQTDTALNGEVKQEHQRGLKRQESKFQASAELEGTVF